MEEGGIPPTLHGGRHQPPRIGQVGHQRPSITGADAEVVSQVNRCPDAVTPRRDLQQITLGIGLSRRRPGQNLGGHEPVERLVGAFEVPDTAAAHFANPEKPIHRPLPVGPPVPPRTVARAWVAQVAGCHRPVGTNLIEHRFHVLGPILGQRRQPRPRPARSGPGLRPPQQRFEFHGSDGRLVRPRLEHLTGLPQPVVEMVAVVDPKTAVHGQVVRPADSLHGIQLQQAEASHHPTKMSGVYPTGRRLVAEPLGGQRNAPCRGGVEGDRCRNQTPCPTPPRKGSRSAKSPSRPSDLAANASPISEGWNIPACQVAM